MAGHLHSGLVHSSIMPIGCSQDAPLHPLSLCRREAGRSRQVLLMDLNPHPLPLCRRDGGWPRQGAAHGLNPFTLSLSAGEMVVGPAKVLLMDSISTGLDSSTTYLIVR